MSTEGFTLDFAKNSYRSQKGVLARALKRLKNSVDQHIASPNSESIRIINQDLDYMREKRDLLEEKASRLIEHEDADEVTRTATENELNKIDNDYSEVRNNAISNLRANTVQMAPQSQGGPSSKVNIELKPETLTRDNNPIEMTGWIRKFTSYFQASKFDHESLLIQQAHFFNCIDNLLAGSLKQEITDSTRIFPNPADAGEESCIGILEREFKKRYPIFRRRMDCISTKQRNGEILSDTYTRMREIGDTADISDLGPDDLYALLLINACNDNKLKDELLLSKDQTLANLLEIVAAYESAQASIGTSYGRKMTKNKHKAQPKRQFNPRENYKDKCIRCGSFKHSQNDCSGRNNICSKCGKKGHYQKSCLSKPTSNPNNTRKTSEKASENKKQE